MKNQNKALTKVLILGIFFSFMMLPNLLKAQRTELNMSQIPQAVVDAIQTDFPTWDINKTKWYAYSQDMSEWAPADDGIQYYAVDANGENFKVRAIYTSKGKLRYSKTTIKNSALPHTILNKIKTDEEYKGWTITGTQEVIRDFKEDKKTFKVSIEKDGKKKTVYFDRMGNKVKRRGLSAM